MAVMQRRAQDTRNALLEAARAVFTEVGYDRASVADVVARAGSSVGSMYHHFPGKADLFLALYEEYQVRQEARADEAARQTVADGETDPVRVFLAGGGAYLRGAWEERDLARLFLDGDGPPGFERAMSRRFSAWVRRGGGVLRNLEESRPPRPADGAAYSLVLTAAIRAAGQEMVRLEDEAAATALADEVMRLLARLDPL